MDESIRLYLLEVGKLPRLTRGEERAAVAEVQRTRSRFRLSALQNEFVLRSAIERMAAVCDGHEVFHQVVEVSATILSSERKRILDDIGRRLLLVKRTLDAGESDYRTATSADRPARLRHAAWRRLVRRRREAARLIEQSTLRTECLLGPLDRLAGLCRRVRQILDELGRNPQAADVAGRGQLDRQLAKALCGTGETARTLLRRMRKSTAARQAFHAAKNVLLCGNLRLVIAIAKRYCNRGICLLDLIQEGNLGLMRAIEKSGGLAKYGFSTYATWWIHQAIRQALGEQGGPIQVPPHVMLAISRLRGTANRLWQDMRQDPNLDQVADATGLSPGRLLNLMQLQRRPLRLTSGTAEEGAADDEIDSRVIADYRRNNLSREFSQRYLSNCLDGALAMLGDCEQQTLRLRFGLADGSRYTLREVGAMLSLSSERIRQIERDSLLRLRSSPAVKCLEHLLVEE